MSDPFARLRRFLRELRRRKVYRVAAVYAGVAFLVVQAANLVFPALNIPSWAYSLVVVLALLGFPIAVVLAWAFEVTPEGVQRTPKEETEAGPSEPASSGLGGWIAVLLILVLAGGGAWYLAAGGDAETATESAATSDTTAARTVSTARDTTGPPRIAVLPFENIARDTGDAFFAQGMHEEVLSQLSKVSGLGVLSRTTMMEYADAEMTAAEIGHELDANAILEGTVRRAGDQLRITTQLIDARQGTHLWSNTYDRTLSPDAVFDIQADIAEQIAGALQTQLAGDERRRIEDAPTEDLAAYEAYLRGRGQVQQFWIERTPELLDRASRNLREAIGRDASFAEAHAWLARAHSAQLAHLSHTATPRWLDSATAALGRARRIDPDVAAVHIAQAEIYQRQGSLQAEAEALRRALTLQPSHAIAKAALAENLSRRGQYAEAVRVAREAVRLDPRRPEILTGMGNRLQDVGLYDAAEAWFSHALEIEPGNVPAQSHLAFNELEQGRPERARALWEDLYRQTDTLPDAYRIFASWAALSADRPKQARGHLQQVREEEAGVGVRGFLGFAELRLGNEERGRQLVRELAEASPEYIEQGERLGRPFGVFQAGAFAYLGRTEAALRKVERVAEEGPGEGWLKWFPILETLRSNPRFQEIVRQVEVRREEARKEIRRMDLDLYPPGAEADAATQEAQTDE